MANTKIVTIADLHGHLEAFEAFLIWLWGRLKKGWDVGGILVAGDLTNYGPDSEAVLVLMRHLSGPTYHSRREAEAVVQAYPNVADREPLRQALHGLSRLLWVTILGEHDWDLVLGYGSTEGFSGDALAAVGYTRAQLSSESRRFLQGLPTEVFLGLQSGRLVVLREEKDSTGKKVVKTYGSGNPLIHLVHGSPRDWRHDYLRPGDAGELRKALPFVEAPICVVGQTHRTMAASVDGEDVNYAKPEWGIPFDLPKAETLVLCPGSLGQPRDGQNGDPRAAFAVLEVSQEGRPVSLTDYRLKYLWQATCRKLEGAGFDRASLRLRLGQ